MSEPQQGREWKCECGEVLGHILLRGGVQVLQPVYWPKNGYVEGDACVPCPNKECNGSRLWYADDRAERKLVAAARRYREQAEETQARLDKLEQDIRQGKL